MKPSYEQLEAKLRETQELLKKALERIVFLEKEVDRLKDQLNKNSKNSSKPPSTDQKSNTQDKPKNPRGSRPGRNRVSFPPERIDKVVECMQDTCPCCTSKMSPGAVFETLQQVELPKVQAVVTEYILRKSSCKACGQIVYGELPKGIPHSAFGPNLMGLLGSLTGAFHLSKRDAIQLIKDIYDIDIGIGSVPNIEEKVTLALDPIYERIQGHILEGKFCKYFDETPWRDRGKRNYVWIATSDRAAVYSIDIHRNEAAFKKIIRGKDLKEEAMISDRYAVYVGKSNKHQFCLAHLIREFKAFAEKCNEDGRIGLSLQTLLSLACHEHKEYKEGRQDKSQRNRKIGKVRKKVEKSLCDGVGNGSDKLSGLCDRLLNAMENLWMFTKIEGMEPTNNLAERDLRKIVLWRKKSYGTRSDRGKRFVERITTITQTLRKNGQNVIKYIQEAIRSFFQGTKPKLINPSLGF